MLSIVSSTSLPESKDSYSSENKLLLFISTLHRIKKTPYKVDFADFGLHEIQGINLLYCYDLSFSKLQCWQAGLMDGLGMQYYLLADCLCNACIICRGNLNLFFEKPYLMILPIQDHSMVQY